MPDAIAKADDQSGIITLRLPKENYSEDKEVVRSIMLSGYGVINDSLSVPGSWT